jgi:enterobactin synthetase component D
MKDSQETKLQTYILREDENTQFNELSKQVAHPLSVVFSAKESIFKALYPFVGKYFGFDKARLITFSETTLTYRVMHNLSKQVKVGLEVNVHYQLTGDLVFTQCLYEAK